MRRDMKDVIIDTSKAKGRTVGYRRRRRSRNWPKDRSQEKMKTPYSWEDTRQQRDRLTPLWRAIKARAGTPWNEVYSELCEVADPRNIRGYHLRDHVKGMIEFSYYDEGTGLVMVGIGNNFTGPKPLNEYHKFTELMYVDPQGILRVRPPVANFNEMVKNHRARARKRPINFIETSDGNFYKSEDLIWYRIKLETVSKVEERWRNFPDTYDHIVRSRVSYDYLLSLYGKPVRCIDKKQLSNKELKKYKLKNGEE